MHIQNIHKSSGFNYYSHFSTKCKNRLLHFFLIHISLSHWSSHKITFRQLNFMTFSTFDWIKKTLHLPHSLWISRKISLFFNAKKMTLERQRTSEWQIEVKCNLSKPKRWNINSRIKCRYLWFGNCKCDILPVCFLCSL